MPKTLFVLYSHNPSRLAHLQKLNTLRSRFRVILLANAKAAPEWVMTYVDGAVVVPPTLLEEPRALAMFLAANFSEAPHAILNLSEACVPLHAALCEHYNLPGPTHEQAFLGRDKLRMRQICQGLGVRIPKFREITLGNFAQIQDLKAPWIVKPCIGGGSTLVRRFESLPSLSQELTDFDRLAKKQYGKDALYSRALNEKEDFRFIAEEDIGGSLQFPSQFPYTVGEVSVESFHFGDEAKILAIHDKPIPGDNPYFEEHIWSTPTRIPTHLLQQIEETMQKIHRYLGPNCHVLHTEFRTLDNEVVLLEFGIRMGGGPIYSSVLRSTGFDVIDALIERGAKKKLPFGNYALTAKPVITHSLWGAQPGVLKAVRGEKELVQLCGYQEHQIYDQPGDVLIRAPLASRGHGHVVFAGETFEILEENCLRGLSELTFEINREIVRKGNSL